MYELFDIKLVNKEEASKHLLKVVKTIEMEGESSELIVNSARIIQCHSYVGSRIDSDPYVTPRYQNSILSSNTVPSKIGFVDVNNITGGLSFKDKMDYFDFINNSKLFGRKIKKLVHYEYTDNVNDYLFGRPIIANNKGYFRGLYNYAEYGCKHFKKDEKYTIFYTKQNINVSKSPIVVKRTLAEMIAYAYANKLKELGVTSQYRLIERVLEVLTKGELKGGTYIISLKPYEGAYISTIFSNSLHTISDFNLFAVVPGILEINDRKCKFDVNDIPGILRYYKFDTGLNNHLIRNNTLRIIVENYDKIINRSSKIPGLIIIPYTHRSNLNTREKMIMVSLIRFATLPQFYPVGRLLVDLIHNIDPRLKPKLLELLAIVRFFIVHQNGYYNFLYRDDNSRNNLLVFRLGDRELITSKDLFIYNEIDGRKYAENPKRPSDANYSNAGYFFYMYKMSLLIKGETRIKEVSENMVIPYLNKDYNKLLLGYRKIAHKYKFLVTQTDKNNYKQRFVVTGIKGDILQIESLKTPNLKKEVKNLYNF